MGIVKRMAVIWRRGWLFLALATLLALALRLSYLALFVGPGYVPEGDASQYSAFALRLAHGEGLRLENGQLTAIRSPLFPLLLAGVYRLRDGDVWLGLLFQASIGALTIPPIFLAGRRAFGGVTARVAALIAAAYPLLIWSTGALLSEPLFVLLVTLALAAALGAAHDGRRRHALWLGLWLGLASLTRPNGLWLAPFLLGWLLVAGKGALRQRLVNFVLVVAVIGAVMAPWIVRNGVIFGKFIPTTTGGGFVVLGAYNERILTEPDLHGSWVSPCEVPALYPLCEMPEVPRDAAQMQAAAAFVRTHLADLPRMAWWRFVKFWHLYPFAHGFPANFGFYAYVAVALFALAGLWMTRSRWRYTGLLAAFIACFMMTGVLLWADTRMRLPAEPALIVLAAGGLAHRWDRADDPDRPIGAAA